MSIVENNGRFECTDCLKKWSATMGDDEIPDTCDCDMEFKTLQMCSGHLLCDNYPDHWHELSEQQQHDFINENIWEFMEGAYEPWMIEQIGNLADATSAFINKHYVLMVTEN